MYFYINEENVEAQHIFTTRGIDFCQDNIIHAKANVAGFLNISPDRIVFPKQVSSNKVGIVKEENWNSQFRGCDALVTNIPGIALGIVSADCVPILLYDKKKNVCAVVHAGWRGTVLRIAENTVEIMESVFHCRPQHIKAVFGPAILQQNYEVGEDVYKAFIQHNHPGELFVPSQKKHHFYLDLCKGNAVQLINKGIGMSGIQMSGLCTFGTTFDDLKKCNFAFPAELKGGNTEKAFYSARRQGVNTGRQASVIVNGNVEL